MAKIPVFVFTKYSSELDKLLDPYNENRHKEWVNVGVAYSSEVNAIISDFDIRCPLDRELSLSIKLQEISNKYENIAYKIEDETGEVVKLIRMNPRGKWDYYHITDTELPEYPPFAFISPDGAWHERGKALHFLQVEDDIGDDEWEKIWNNAIEKYGKRGFLVKVHF